MNAFLEFIKRSRNALLLGLLLGFVLGLVWAYLIQPVEWTNVPPSQLGATFQEDFLHMVIDSYELNGDVDDAERRWQELGSEAPEIFKGIAGNPGNHNPATLLEISDVFASASAATPGATSQTAAGEADDSSLMSYALIFGALVAVGAVGYMLYRFMRPMVRRRRGELTPAQRERELREQTEITDYEAMGGEQPVLQFVTSYTIGTDLFDDSFSIDSPSGEVLGECGFAISKTIGVGDHPKRVTAFEIWLFDKHDIETVTKVLMSKHAHADDSFKRDLQAKGELVLVEQGKQIVLDTATLQMVTVITNFAYGEGALPDNSYFDHLTLEIAVWQKMMLPE